MSESNFCFVAEHAFIPIQASQFDVWTLSRANELVKTARGFNSGLRAFIVLSRISPDPSVTERAEAEEAIKDFEGPGARPIRHS